MHVKKSLGQHFLKDRKTLDAILKAAELSPHDIVLEIGPGTGVLTDSLAPRIKKLIAIEKDEALCTDLKRRFTSNTRVVIECADILRWRPSKYALVDNAYKIVANIPYYLTGRLLRLMYGTWPLPKIAVLLMQKEVAERICARPPRMNRLAAIVQLFAVPKIVASVPKSAFWPAPKVASALIRLETRANASASKRSLVRTVALVSEGFSQPRKYMLSNLKRRYSLKKLERAMRKLGFSPKIRSAELSVEDWKRLSTLLF